MSSDTTEPFQPVVPQRQYQFSLVTLLMAMVIFAIMSACLLFASQLKLVNNEIHAWMGSVPSSNLDGSDRFFQLVFLIVCYSAPLLLVAVLNTFVLAMRAMERRRLQVGADDEQEWRME